MIRKQLLITEDQNRRLKAQAAATARSEGDLVREAVDDWLGRKEAEQQDWKAAWDLACGIWADRTDLDEVFPRLRRSWDRDKADAKQTLPRRGKR